MKVIDVHFTYEWLVLEDDKTRNTKGLLRLSVPAYPLPKQDVKTFVNIVVKAIQGAADHQGTVIDYCLKMEKVAVVDDMDKIT